MEMNRAQFINQVNLRTERDNKLTKKKKNQNVEQKKKYIYMLGVFKKPQL